MAEPLVGIDAPISTLWNADTCPAPLLPWLAWSFSVEIWDHDWSEATRRSVVREAIGVHQWKGTKTAIKRVLAAVGFDIELRARAKITELDRMVGACGSMTRTGTVSYGSRGDYRWWHDRPARNKSKVDGGRLEA